MTQWSKNLVLIQKRLSTSSDIAKNLGIGHKRGCVTVWLKNDEHFGKMDADKDFITHKIEKSVFISKRNKVIKKVIKLCL